MSPENEAPDEGPLSDNVQLALIDLFGCGFIATIFLFFALVAGSRTAASPDSPDATTSTRGAAIQGPVVVTVEVPREFDVLWPLAKMEQVSAGRKVYTALIRDASQVRWPQKFAVSNQGQPASYYVPVSIRVSGGASQTSLTADTRLLTTSAIFAINVKKGFEITASGLASAVQTTYAEVHAPRLKEARYRLTSLDDGLAQCELKATGRDLRIRLRRPAAASSLLDPSCTTNEFTHVVFLNDAAKELRCNPQPTVDTQISEPASLTCHRTR